MAEQSTDDVDRYHASVLTEKVLSDNPHRTLNAWIDGLDEEQTEQVVSQIYGAVGDVLTEQLSKDGVEADIDREQPRYMVENED